MDWCDCPGFVEARRVGQVARVLQVRQARAGPPNLLEPIRSLPATKVCRHRQREDVLRLAGFISERSLE